VDCNCKVNGTPTTNPNPNPNAAQVDCNYNVNGASTTYNDSTFKEGSNYGTAVIGNRSLGFIVKV
jgi:hypothetical protein